MFDRATYCSVTTRELVSKFGSVTTRKEPEELQVYLWETSRKVSSDCAPNDWKRLSIKSVVRKYTEHPSAVMFSAPQAEPQLEDLKWADRKDRKKLYIKIQNSQGAIGAMATKFLVMIQGTFCINYF